MRKTEAQRWHDAGLPIEEVEQLDDADLSPEVVQQLDRELIEHWKPILLARNQKPR